MKILIHALGICQGGGLTHLKSLVTGLDREMTNHQYVVLVRRSLPWRPVLSKVQLEYFPDWMSRRGPARILNDIFWIPQKIKKDRFDVLVSVGNFGALKTPVPHIVIQRNLRYFATPLFSMAGLWEKMSILLSRWYLNKILKNATLIVTPSQTMASSIKNIYPDLPESKFYTLYHAGDADERHDIKHARRKSTILARIPQDRIKIFYPAYPYAHKGFPVLIDTFICLIRQRSNVTLILTVDAKELEHLVPRKQAHIQSLLQNGQLVLPGRLDYETVKEIYRVVDMLLFSSVIEAFGFPLLEAMMRGLPIVAADSSISREICGDAAVYFNREDAKAGADAVEKALSAPERERLKEAMRQRIRDIDWSWERYIREFVQLLERSIAISKK